MMKQENKHTLNSEDLDGNEMMCFTYIREQDHLNLSPEEAEKLCSTYGLKDPQSKSNEK